MEKQKVITNLQGMKEQLLNLTVEHLINEDILIGVEKLHQAILSVKSVSKRIKIKKEFQ